MGNYTSVTDNDEWRFGSLESRSSLIKFSPQFLIAPGRMVRMMSMGTKPADMRIDLAMGVPLEFLTSEMWFCTNCCRNTLFTRVLEEVRNLPILSDLSNMTIMERLCPAIGVCPVPFARNAGVVDPDNAREYMQPMKWMYDRPAKVLHEYAQKYRVDIPIRITELKVSADLIVPALKVDLYTMNFGDAADRPGWEDTLVRADGWTIGNHLWIIPPCENDMALRQRWLRSVAPLPTVELNYRERLAFSGTHEKVDQDIIEPGGDTGDMEAAFAEMDQEKPREPKDTAFGQAHITCGPSIYDDERKNIADEFRPMMKCALCQKDPTRISEVPHETRKFYSMTSHVTYQHDACVYPSSRGYTYQQLVGGRQVCAARYWMNSALIEQTREDPSRGKPHTWSERKLTRVHDQSETNGDLAPLLLVDQDKNADHLAAPTATPVIDKKCAHILVRDEYPEVVHAEKAAESNKRYQIPPIAPEVMVEWSKKLVDNQPAKLYQMDPLSSPHELSPMYGERTPLVWFTPAGMKMFLRPSDENLEEAWMKATALLCITIHTLREACELTDFRQTSFGSTYMALLGCAQVMKIESPWTDPMERQGLIMKKSQEGLYTTQQESNFYLEQWETMHSRSKVIQEPESPAITYSNNDIMGLSTDCRALTRATCGIAVDGDQQSIIADLILDVGITRSKTIAGAIQRKEAYLKTWVDTYNLYKDKCKHPNDIKNMLKDRLIKSWDSWPSKVWKMTEEGVQLVKEHIDKTRVERCTGIMRSFWNTFRKKTSGTPMKQEQPEDLEMINHPDSFTGDLPTNSIVGLECSDRPDQLPFINAINEAKQSHDDDQMIMTCKTPGAFEWKMNQGWDAENRLQQRIHLEESKDPHLWDGPFAQRIERFTTELHQDWSLKHRKRVFNECMETNKDDLSEKENMLFRWMCIHITLGGTPTTNPKAGNVFDYVHHAINVTADLVLDHIQGTGLTGLYSASEYSVNDPNLDAWIDESLGYIWEQFPIKRSLYIRAQTDHHKFTKAIVRCVAVMMNEYQLYHFDMPTVFALSPEQWRVWCMQWHMFKRDYEIARTHLLIPEAGCRYEVVSVYLETLMRLEVTETESVEGGVRQRWVQVCPSPYKCPYCEFKFQNYTSVTNAATGI